MSFSLGKNILLSTAIMLVISHLPFSSLAETPEKKTNTQTPKILDRVTVIGGEDKREKIPGSANIVTPENLERFQYTDVHRALQEVAGVNIQEEDGFGLRPNIGIRGGRSNRSADITLMEDGVLAAPAPYAAPEAYYFPQMDRMESLEVIKGVGAVKYGPRTTNGVLNMVTKPIPAKKQADFIAEFGSHGSWRTGVTAGQSFEQTGIMVNAIHKESDGFKTIDFVGGDTGYEVDDILTKLRFNSADSATYYQELELKFGYYNETSHETYLGLSDQDFAARSNRRYAASQLDEMGVQAYQLGLSHFIEFSPDTNLTTSIYHNGIDRSWYRLASVQIGGIRRDLSAIFNNPTTSAAYLAALQTGNSSGNSFIIRDNNREYYAQGVQSILAVNHDIGDVKNKLEAGIRYHRDEEDRFQREDRFDLVNGRAVINSIGAAGNGGNRVQSADAWSGFVQNEMSWQEWTLTPGIRFEHINLKREDYGNNNPNRSTPAQTLENTLDVWIPGVGLRYQAQNNWQILGGVHKGFAPPGVPSTANEAAFSREESSVNYEIGTRYQEAEWSGELFAFFTDYDNLLGRDSFSSGGAGTGDVFNGGKVQVKGIEASAQYNAAPLLGSIMGMDKSYRLPLAISYTLTKGEFKNSFVSSFEEWGTVKSGDELPYMPNHQLYLSAGLENNDWGVSLGAKYVSEMRGRAGSGSIPNNQLIDAHWTVDVAGEYKITEQLTAFARVENLLDETYIAARRPAGVRPSLPLTAMTGVKIALW
ncbi:MAG: TonB-dependent receptor family protein [Alphaproteobacteria bacterium]